MVRKIHWITGCHDEIELVYEKAEQNEKVGQLLSELEQMALTETEESCGLLSINGEPITREMVLNMSRHDKEVVMHSLARVGLAAFSPSMREPKIVVRFGPHIQSVLGCTMFSLLNRIEKIDGAYNVVRFPKATLELQFPLGGRNGMFKWEILIMQLYPWLSVSETSYNTLSEELPKNDPPEASHTAHPQAAGDSEPPAPAKEKKHFFSKLFRRESP